MRGATYVALALLLAGALAATAQEVTVCEGGSCDFEPDELNQAIASALASGGEGTVVLFAPRSATSVIPPGAPGSCAEIEPAATIAARYTLENSLILSDGDNLTIRVEDCEAAKQRPYSIVIESDTRDTTVDINGTPTTVTQHVISGPMFTLSNDASLKLEGVTLNGYTPTVTDPGSGGPSMGVSLQSNDEDAAGVSLSMNRTLVKNFSGAGISQSSDKASTVVGNSVFSQNDDGITISEGSLTAAFCTMIQNSGDGIAIDKGGSGIIIGSLLFENGGAGIRVVSAQGKTSRAINCLSKDNGTDYAGSALTNVQPSNEPVTLAIPSLFPGDVDVGILGDGVLQGSLPISLNEFTTRDIEYDVRGQFRQIGADQEGSGSGLGLVWTDTVYSVTGGNGVGYDYPPDERLYIGAGSTVEVTLFGDSEFTNADEIIVVPEVIWRGGASGLTPTDSIVLKTTAADAGEGFLRGTFSVSDRVNGLPMDGLLRVYLRKVDITLDAVGPGLASPLLESLVTDRAIANATDKVLIDTVPPALVADDDPASTAPPINAAALLASAPGDDATDETVAPVPPGWGALASNAYTLPSGTPAAVNSGSVTGGGTAPRVFLNPADGENLNFGVVAYFRDLPPTDAEGNPYPVTTAGFDEALRAAQADALANLGNATATDIRANGNLGVNAVVALNLGGGSDFDGTEEATLSVSPFAGATAGLQANWGFTSLPNYSDDNGYNQGYWQATFAPQAIDRAYNETANVKQAQLWWLTPTAAAITTTRYQGDVQATPSYHVALERGEDPGTTAETQPSVPIYSARLWAAEGTDPDTCSWTAIDGGATSSAAASSAGDTALEAAINLRQWRASGDFSLDSAAVLSDPRLRGRYLMLTVFGGDEAGNVQYQGTGNQIGSRFQLNGLVDYDWWYNPGAVSAVGSEAAIQFWYDRSLDGLIDPGEELLGSGPEVPRWPAAAVPVPPVLKGRVNVSYTAPNDPSEPFPTGDEAQVKAVLYADGVLVDDQFSVTLTSSGTLSFLVPDELGQGITLGDYSDLRGGTAKRVQYKVVVTVVSHVIGVTETMTSSLVFTVVPPGEVSTEEQPIKTFERQ